VLPGPDTSSAPGGLDALCSVEWRIGSDSDRMGLRLEGPPIAGGSNDRLTAPTTWGAIQLPAGGGPIILLADGQPTGGYPVFAVAITADHPILGQLPPGATLRFEAVSVATARDALAAQRRDLAEARRAIRLATGWDDLWLHAGG
jgi:antagonist of KipI